VNGWDVFTGSGTVPPGALVELAALRAALPGYDVMVTSHSRTHRFEATHRGNGPGTCCVISSDPADLWRELAGRPRPAALDGDDLDRALAAPQPATGAPLVPFDPTRPNIARAYDYLLGGKDHFPPDRELAERLVALYPGVRQMVRENRRFLVRALDYVAAQGITQYVDLGAGLPTSPAVHEIVHRHDATASVVYADNDPVVLNHLWALAAKGDDHINAVAGDVARPAAVAVAAQATGLIDWGKPVCLIAAMVLHFLDAATARAVAAAYVSGLAPGSHVIITVACGEPAIGAQITRTYDAAPVFNHTPADVASFFTGLDVIKPGVADARAWMPGWRTPAPYQQRPGQVLAGIGVRA